MNNEWLAPHDLWIVGHRGAPRRARENTLDSFDFAESLGADAVELDLRQTRDGELAVFHDAEIEIGTDRHPVRRMAASDVRALLLDSPLGEYRVPMFSDVLARYGPALRYVAEMKVTEGTDRQLAARRLTRLLREFSATGRTLVASFDLPFLREVRELDRDAALSLLLDEPGELPAGAAGVFQAVGPRADRLTPEWAESARRAGLSVHPWTVDAPEEMTRLAELGVASITTNDVELALVVLRPK